MLTITIEASNPFEEEKELNPIDVSSISDSSYDSSSNVYEYINVFVRAMLGMSFTKQTILNALSEYSKDENIVFSDFDDLEAELGNFDSELPEDFEIDPENI